MEKAADTFSWAAIEPSLQNVTGKYFINRKPIMSSFASRDVEFQDELWRMTEKLVNKQYKTE